MKKVSFFAKSNRLFGQTIPLLGFDAKRMVTATGGRSDFRKGRLEFYVGSKFVMEITTRIRQNVCWTTADIDPKELKRITETKN